LNFHQFIFLCFERLKNNEKLVLLSDITKILNNYGFFISKEFENEIKTKQGISENDFTSYTVMLQNYIEIYSNNLN
jgi:hypothetical protein